MKRIISNILTILIIFSAVSCTDFLDVQPRGQSIAYTVEHYDGLLNYYNFMNFTLSENDYAYWKNDEIVVDEKCYDAICTYSLNPQSILCAYQFQDEIYRKNESCYKIIMAYKQIYTYNMIISEVLSSVGSDEAKQYVYAEARMARAYMYFLLAQWFGSPYNESIADSELILPIDTIADTQAKDFNRATMREMYDFILSEMEEACPNLKDRSEHLLRVYKPTGYAMLGKVYWTIGKYDKALEKMKVSYDLLKGGKYNITLRKYMTDQSKFNYTEIPVKQIRTWIGYKNRDPQVLFLRQNSQVYFYYFQNSGLPLYYLKQEYYDLFDSHDLRRNIISTATATGQVLKLPFAGFQGSFVDFGVEYPEVFLILAECYARSGQLDNAKAVLEEFRSYRMYTGYETVPAEVVTQNDYIKFCVDEQTREFLATGYRWYNMRRLWNDPLFSNVYTHTYGGQTYTLKESQLKEEIPETVLMWNENWR